MNLGRKMGVCRTMRLILILATLAATEACVGVSASVGATMISQPADAIVQEGKTAAFQAVFESSSVPEVQWYGTAEPNTALTHAVNPRVSTQLSVAARRPIYTATLSIEEVGIAQAGGYYCRITNASDMAVDSAVAQLRFKGLMAHWTLDQNDFVDGLYRDCVGGHHARPKGRPEFVAGADGRVRGAIPAHGPQGWGQVEGFDPTGGTGEVTISLWANQQDASASPEDPCSALDPNSPSSILASELRADGRWHCLCAAFDGVLAKVYVDAVPTAARPCPLPSSDAILASIGLRADAQAIADCALDDVRLYSEALTPSQVAALYEEMVGAQEVVDAGTWGVHDPTIVQQGDTFYLFSTGRGVPIRRSKDLYHWESVGRVFDTLPRWVTQAIPGVSDLWAPDVFYRDGRYRVYYAASTLGSKTSCIGLVSNVTLDQTDPNYAWVDEGRVLSSDNASSYNAIDPDAIQDPKGQWWLSFGSYWSGIALTGLNSETGLPDTYPPTLYPIASRPSTAIEGSFVFYRDGYYYLFVSFDQCCQGVNSTYNIRVGRSAYVAGPYRDRDGVRMGDGGGSLVLEGNQRWKGPGHNSVLRVKGQDYLVYHAYDAQNNGRSALRIRPLYWSADLWPEVGTVITAPVQ